MKTKARPTTRDVARFVENQIAPLKYSLPGDQNGLLFGSSRGKVKGLMVCWSPTLSVIESAISLDANLIISHEWLVYNRSDSKWVKNNGQTLAKIPNLKRLGLLSQHNMSVLKYHSNWDIAPGGIVDSFGEHVGFGKPIHKGMVARVYRERPMLLGELANMLKQRLKTRNVEISGTLNEGVRYIGTAIGGLGQIFTYADEFTEWNPEVIIFGEMLQYTKIYTREAGYSYIATSHEASEMPGMLKLAFLLVKRFPQVPVNYSDSSGHEIAIQE